MNELETQIWIQDFRLLCLAIAPAVLDGGLASETKSAAEMVCYAETMANHMHRKINEVENANK